MSEATPEREIEIVAGVIEGVIQKKPDTWQVEVRPDGSQYTKKLWTKDSELVSALSAKLGQAGAFVCGASYWTNQSGTQVRSLWINQEGLEGVTVEAPQPTPEAAVALAHVETSQKRQRSSQDVPPEVWEAKERRDYRSRAWAQSLGALTHTIKVEESTEDIYRRVYALQRKIYRDVVRDLDPEAFPDDDVPF